MGLGSVGSSQSEDYSWDTEIKTEKDEELARALIENAERANQQDSQTRNLQEPRFGSSEFQEKVFKDFAEITGLSGGQKTGTARSSATNPDSYAFLPEWATTGVNAVRQEGVNLYLTNIGIDKELRSQVGLDEAGIVKLLGNKDGLNSFLKQAREKIEANPTTLNAYLEVSSKLLIAGKNQSDDPNPTNMLLPNYYEKAKTALKENQELSTEAKDMLNQFLDNPAKIQELKLSPEETDALKTLKEAKKTILGPDGKASIDDVFAFDSTLLGNSDHAKTIISQAKGETFGQIGGTALSEGWAGWRAAGGFTFFGHDVGGSTRDAAIARSRGSIESRVTDDLPEIALLGMNSSKELQKLHEEVGFDKAKLLEEAGGAMPDAEARRYLSSFATRDPNEPLTSQEKVDIARAYYGLNFDESKQQMEANLSGNKAYIDQHAKTTDFKDNNINNIKSVMEGLMKAREMSLESRNYNPEEIKTGTESAISILATGLASKATITGIDLNTLKSVTTESLNTTPSGFIPKDVNKLFEGQDQATIDKAHGYAYYQNAQGETFAIAKANNWSGKRVDGTWQPIDTKLEQELRNNLTTNQSTQKIVNSIFEKAQASFIENGYTKVDKNQFYGDDQAAKTAAGDNYSFFMNAQKEKIAISNKGSWSGKWDGQEWQKIDQKQETDLRDFMNRKTETQSQYSQARVASTEELEKAYPDTAIREQILKTFDIGKITGPDGKTLTTAVRKDGANQPQVYIQGEGWKPLDYSFTGKLRGLDSENNSNRFIRDFDAETDNARLQEIARTANTIYQRSQPYYTYSSNSSQSKKNQGPYKLNDRFRIH